VRSPPTPTPTRTRAHTHTHTHTHTQKILNKSTFKLHERCSNNQAEQVAILRALEQIQNLQLAEDTEKIAVVNTDSKVTLDALQNRNKHYTLVESIRKN